MRCGWIGRTSSFGGVIRMEYVSSSTSSPPVLAAKSAPKARESERRPGLFTGRREPMIDGRLASLRLAERAGGNEAPALFETAAPETRAAHIVIAGVVDRLRQDRFAGALRDLRQEKAPVQPRQLARAGGFEPDDGG